ncbi:hypothetical protein [Mariniblastus fucicola]|uniref:Uncharacterized protein n=1 Tax=Mariniblastus fucicola TaxID=980251 RepID=A0A5B9PI66_9BACT|nr:hypothetical protein [Mariniblastus fucicola]QEG24990.1 hypothetical protein MFFC18_49130 [Mariniblastus fucicola]
MTPMSRFINGLSDLITDTAGATFDMFERMDTVQLATLSICVLVVAGMCLRGNPVRGA